ncbi:hypothetical protein HG530_001980 [Fusarium avenaceum]|nr:hypothetical protein HG530_001980 [Fusarium avenaceum]
MANPPTTANTQLRGVGCHAALSSSSPSLPPAPAVTVTVGRASKVWVVTRPVAQSRSKSGHEVMVCDVSILALARVTGHSVGARSNSGNILISAVGSLGEMNLLVIPVKDKVSSTEERIAKNLLVGGRNETDITRARTKLQNEIAEGDFDDLVAKAKINGSVDIAVLTTGHVKALTVILGAELFQDRASDGHIERKHTTVDKALVSHGGKQQAVRLLAIKSSAQIRRKAQDALRDTVALHQHTKRLVLQLRVSKGQGICEVFDCGRKKVLVLKSHSYRLAITVLALAVLLLLLPRSLNSPHVHRKIALPSLRSGEAHGIHTSERSGHGTYRRPPHDVFFCGVEKSKYKQIRPLQPNKERDFTGKHLARGREYSSSLKYDMGVLSGVS